MPDKNTIKEMFADWIAATIVYNKGYDKEKFVNYWLTRTDKKFMHKNLIEIFTDPGDVVIDPCAGSGSTLIAAERLRRKGYGFEIKKEFWTKANQWLEEEKQMNIDIDKYGFPKSKMEKTTPTLWS